MSTTQVLPAHLTPLDIGTPLDTLLTNNSNKTSALPAQRARKRKHAEFREEISQLGLPFTIRAHPSLPSPKSQTLIPRLLIPRSCLPLAYLDSVNGQEDPLGSVLFAARIENLEGREQEDEQAAQPMVLIAQSAIDERLYAVEKVHNGIYALCRLGSWVTYKVIKRLQTGAMDYHHFQKAQNQERTQPPTDKWWRAAAIMPDSEVAVDAPSAAKIPRVQLCLQKPKKNRCLSVPVIDQKSSASLPEQLESPLSSVSENTTQAPEEMLATIRSQYQEALYASKTSLAYFAKGTLSRARAAFNSQDGSSYDRLHLVEYLKNGILSLATMDAKYRETVPSMVKDLPFGPLSEDESVSIATSLVKKVRKSKKAKVGKNGIYPGEEASITRWWLSRDAASTGCDSVDAREDAIRLALLQQRARETQMQIILVLEVLALESSSVLPSTEQNPIGDNVRGDEESKNRKKAKKPRDLLTLLDLLVDRLSIWQSMSMEDDKTSKEDRTSAQHSAKALQKTSGSDQLQQFCVDVVLPFYAARLPELTTLLCQKLGGLKQPSPRRPTFTKAATSQVLHKPGTLVPRVPNRRPRRTLERVLTEERSASHNSLPSLLRSATDPILPQLKREISDTSLSSIPLNKVAMQKRYSQREVDLHAASQVTETKLKKKAKIEQELQSAIAALKKPNPRMAVKELVEDAEKRVAASRSRKSKHPMRNPFAQGVQVTATPSKNRLGNSRSGLPQPPPPRTTAPAHELEDVPLSSASHVPWLTEEVSSGLVKNNTQRFSGRNFPSVEQTPTRGASKFLGYSISSATKISPVEIMQSSPVGPGLNPPSVVSGQFVSYKSPPRSLNNQETPTKHRTAYQCDRTEEPVVEATPMKVSSTSRASNSPVYEPEADASPLQPQEPETSIYACLGWDDEVDELA